MVTKDYNIIRVKGNNEKEIALRMYERSGFSHFNVIPWAIFKIHLHMHANEDFHYQHWMTTIISYTWMWRMEKPLNPTHTDWQKTHSFSKRTRSPNGNFINE